MATMHCHAVLSGSCNYILIINTSYRPIIHRPLSVKCQLSDYVFLRRVLRRTIIAKTSNLHQKVGYRQDYKYKKLHAYTPKNFDRGAKLV